jgi:F-type H+-transporting ATPase subunit b
MEALAKLGIDGWGLILYIVNFSVVLFLMHKFVYKPLIRYIDERRHAIKESVEQAAAMRETVEAELTFKKEEEERHLAEQKAKILEAQKFAKESAREMIAQADRERERIIAEAREQSESMIASILEDAERDMKSRIQTIVLSVLKNDIPERAIKKSVDEAVKGLAS